ncbi:CCA tRNA nucleotidyltransferase [Staphylococcus equorum]|uniref:CCA-adding enzyme n=1 Tax=Staphylococcus equorum TaxID=246432 RepID=A0A9X4R2D9_9STAP|nr:CCA tRNA nucleotidyltransferase [Staphylococcus equorum]MDG0842465.1 CCA tRNA nucleotidyltransferase [Staphylococcus equorum]MDG0858403.1 CCA tRNA nucleotidyltransferase [Staphylococcus equorum]
MTKTLFEAAKPILETLQNHNYQAFYVGGAVRDYLMQKPIHDIDITTSATPDEIETVFDKTIPIGKEHGTINVVYNGNQYEVTTFRAEGEYDDHRRPNEVFFVRDLYEDVKRRDFTMNAIAMDMNYQIHDYFNGLQDIEQRLIKTVGDPAERFNEDALRIIRGLRFQSQLGFTLEAATFNGMHTHIADIAQLSIERIVIELKKLTLGQYVAHSFNNLKYFNAFNYIPFFNHFDLSKFILEDSMSLSMFIAFLKVQQPDVNAQLSDLKISNNEKKYITRLERMIQQMPEVQSKQSLNLFVYDYGAEDILQVLSYERMLNDNNIMKVSPFIFNNAAINEVSRNLPISSRKEMDINGKDILQALDKPSGAWLKCTLRQVECAIVSGEVKNFKPELLKWVKTHV